MMQQPLNSHHAYLIALGLSESTSQAVAAIRTDLWRTDHRLSFRILNPLIPLVWSTQQLVFSPNVHFSSPPKSVVFTQLTQNCVGMFLQTEDEQWDSYLQNLRTYLRSLPECEIPHDRFLPPIPLVEGPFIGVQKETGSEKSQNLDPQIMNNDWRLQQYAMHWTEKEQQITHLHYRLEIDRHLI